MTSFLYQSQPICTSVRLENPFLTVPLTRMTGRLGHISQRTVAFRSWEPTVVTNPIWIKMGSRSRPILVLLKVRPCFCFHCLILGAKPFYILYIIFLL